MVSELILCDYCHDSKKRLTEENSQHVFYALVRDPDGKEITRANLHRECAEAWAKAHAREGKIHNLDRPLPPRPAL